MMLTDETPPRHPGSRPWYASLAEGLALQLAQAQRLDELSQDQHAAIAAGDVEVVPDILDARQPVVESLAEISRRCEPLAARLAGAWASIPDPERAALADAVARLSDLIAAISARDAEDRVALERHRASLGAQLAGLGRARGAVDAYLDDASPGRAFQDREA